MSSERKYPLHEALVRLEAYCAYQERCQQEIIAKAALWNFSEDECQELLKELLDSGFVNERRFVESFVSGKSRFKKWGRIKIRYELKKKRIPNELILESFSQIDPDIYYKQMVDLAARKWKETKGKDEWDKRAKVMRYLASKGYESDLISDAVAEVVRFTTE